jgi:hypothetical protein
MEIKMKKYLYIVFVLAFGATQVHADPSNDPELKNRPNQWVPYLFGKNILRHTQLILQPYAALKRQKETISQIKINNENVGEDFHLGLYEKIMEEFDNPVLKPGVWMLTLHDRKNQTLKEIGAIQATFGNGKVQLNFLLDISYLNAKYYDVVKNAIDLVTNFVLSKTSYRKFSTSTPDTNIKLVKALTELGFSKVRGSPFLEYTKVVF